MEGANYLARECAMDYGGHWRDFADSERLAVLTQT
jgi:hypothetical protein